MLAEQTFAPQDPSGPIANVLVDITSPRDPIEVEALDGVCL